MRRAIPLIPLVPLALLAGLPAAAQASAPGSVKVTGCVPALTANARSATYEGRMRASHHSARMQLRFTLQIRSPIDPAWRHVTAEGLDRWLTSNAGVRRYTFAKTVVNLTAPASYRTIVRFRWVGASGRTVWQGRATSAACRQPDLRPNLKADWIDVRPGPDAATRRYVVAVRNGGRTPAGPFAVGLQSADDALEPLTVTGLGIGERRMVTFTGPACLAGAALTATVDPGAAVDERDENDNVLAAACPPA